MQQRVGTRVQIHPAAPDALTYRVGSWCVCGNCCPTSTWRVEVLSFFGTRSVRLKYFSIFTTSYPQLTKTNLDNLFRKRSTAHATHGGFAIAIADPVWPDFRADISSKDDFPGRYIFERCLYIRMMCRYIRKMSTYIRSMSTYIQTMSRIAIAVPVWPDFPEVKLCVFAGAPERAPWAAKLRAPTHPSHLTCQTHARVLRGREAKRGGGNRFL